MIYIYRGCYAFLKYLLLLSKPLLSSNTKTWMALRSNTNFLSVNFTNSLWFHASSGEIEYCKSIITEIKKINPEQKIIISYSSPSAERLLFNIKDHVEFIFPLPWDSPAIIQQALNHLKPRAVIFSRTDFWPEFITQLHKKNIPVIAVSMYPRLNVVSRLMYRWLLRKFSLITTVNSDKSAQLQIILHRPVETFADTRFDQVFARLDCPTKISFASNTLKVVFASTWPEDEKCILSALPQLIEKGFQIILAPHEISRAGTLAQSLQKYQPQILSQEKNLTPLTISSSILIVDQIGYLADIYRSTQWAFVGGSFARKIHSVMEPLAAGNLVFFGPRFYNNPEAVDTQSQGLTHVVRSADDIRLLVQPAAPETLKKNAQDYVQKQRGSSRLIAQKILNQ